MATLTPPKEKELEVHFKPETGKAVIEGKTSVPFQAFVTLVLQRKVFTLFKEWSKEPVIVNSELLTSLASAQQDSPENRAMLILTSLSVGIIAGIGLFAITQLGLLSIDVSLGALELSIVAACVLSLAVVAFLVGQLQRKRKSDKVVAAIESISSFLSK